MYRLCILPSCNQYCAAQHVTINGDATGWLASTCARTSSSSSYFIFFFFFFCIASSSSLCVHNSSTASYLSLLCFYIGSFQLQMRIRERKNCLLVQQQQQHPTLFNLIMYTLSRTIPRPMSSYAVHRYETAWGLCHRGGHSPLVGDSNTRWSMPGRKQLMMNQDVWISQPNQFCTPLINVNFIIS